MSHDGFLIVIFLALTLIIPAVVVTRVWKTISSGARAKQLPSNAADNAKNTEQTQNQKSPDTEVE